MEWEWDRNGTDGRTCRIETCVWFGLVCWDHNVIILLARPLYIYAWEVIL